MPNADAVQQSQPLDAAALLGWYDRHARVLPWRVSPEDRARGVRPDPYLLLMGRETVEGRPVPRAPHEDAAATQARVEQIEKEYNARIEREQNAAEQSPAQSPAQSEAGADNAADLSQPPGD